MGQTVSEIVDDIQLRQLITYRRKENIDINELCTDRYTPLHRAIAIGNLNLVQLIIEHGANVNLESAGPCGLSPLNILSMFYSKTKDAYDIYELLLKKGAYCNEPDRCGQSAFHVALMSQPLKIIQLFLEYGADMKTVNGYGYTALHHAAKNPHTDVVEFVLSLGFDIECQDKYGTSALDAAASEGTPGACKLLLSRGAMVNVKNKSGDTPLCAAVRRQYSDKLDVVQIVELLLEYGTDWTLGHMSILKLATDGRLAMSSEELRICLVRHVVKMQHLNLNISEEDRQLIKNADCYKLLYQQCLKEFERMKETKFYNNVSIFTILMGSDKVISGFARNEELVQALEAEGYVNMFPVYFPLLKKRFDAEVKMQKVRKLAAMSLSDIYKLNDPFHAVTQKILSYTRHEDLNKLLEM